MEEITVTVIIKWLEINISKEVTCVKKKIFTELNCSNGFWSLKNVVFSTVYNGGIKLVAINFVAIRTMWNERNV